MDPEPDKEVAAAVAGFRWSVDVCRYCARVAVWPGCSHWQVHDGWTVAAVMRPAHPGALARRLAQTLGTEPEPR